MSVLLQSSRTLERFNLDNVRLCLEGVPNKQSLSWCAADQHYSQQMSCVMSRESPSVPDPLIMPSSIAAAWKGRGERGKGGKAKGWWASRQGRVDAFSRRQAPSRATCALLMTLVGALHDPCMGGERDREQRQRR